MITLQFLMYLVMQTYVINIVFGYRTAESYSKANNDITALPETFMRLIIAIYIYPHGFGLNNII